MGNNDQKREATHQNESMSQNRDFTLTQLKVWHRQRGRMALVEVPARFNYDYILIFEFTVCVYYVYFSNLFA